MVPLPSLAEIPQLQGLQSQVRRLWAAQTVVVLASDRGLWIAWPSEQVWQVAAGSWPEGCCRDGIAAGSVRGPSRQTCSTSLVWHAFCPWR